jgi:transposase
MPEAPRSGSQRSGRSADATQSAPIEPPGRTRRLDFHSLGVTSSEIEQALARERRARVRKRLAALAAVLAGLSIERAARTARTNTNTVRRCLKLALQYGLQGILHDSRRRRRRSSRSSEERRQTRRDIALALSRPLRPRVRARLMAIDAVLSGRPAAEAAALASVVPATVRSWVREAGRHGIVPILAKWNSGRRPHACTLEADPAELRALAAWETNPRVRKRLLALALVASGLSALEASVRTGMSHNTVLARAKRFRQEGIQACQDARAPGRRKASSPAQIEELRLALRNRPSVTFA